MATNLFKKTSGTGVSEFSGAQSARNASPLTEGMLVKIAGVSTAISCPDITYQGKSLSKAFEECLTPEDVQKILDNLSEEDRNNCFFPKCFDLVEVNPDGSKKSDILADTGIYAGAFSKTIIDFDGTSHAMQGPLAEVWRERAKTTRETNKVRFDAVASDSRVKDKILHVHLHEVSPKDRPTRTVRVLSLLAESYDKNIHNC